MAGTFKFELVSPERVLLSIDADQVVVPGSDGEFAVLAGHAPVIATLRPGVLDVTAGGSKRRLFVKSGFAEVDPSRLTGVRRLARAPVEAACDAKKNNALQSSNRG